MNDNTGEQFEPTDRPARVPLHVQLGCKPFKQQLRICAWILVVADLLLFGLLATTESARDLLRQALKSAPKWDRAGSLVPGN
ncbi:MAG TPA: hypothetical protein VG433_16470 [Pirellulales bacterium]|nr:hypothetical protein [Pirellulales bacterium]